MATEDSTIGPVRTWALAAGGMVGGGIYIALGVVIEAAGAWSWLSFLIAGIAAVITAGSYGALTNRFHEAGGAFDFLERLDRKGFAGSLSWLLILGYMLTIAVYAHAFGGYVAHGVGGGDLVIRGCSIGIVAALVLLDLAGAGKLTAVEVVIVTANLLALLVLAGAGLVDWDVDALSRGIEERPPTAAFLGAAVIFVSYEGFQLLTYEYDDMDQPEGWFTPVLVSAATFVVGVYVAVALGATMISGADSIVQNKGVALSVAAQKAFGTPGLIAMTVAAACATTAAINSTLFSTAKLAGRVADDGELPGWFGHRNGEDIPDRAVIVVGVVAAVLAAFGSLSALVEAASLVFVGTFLVVNLVAVKTDALPAWLAGIGAALSAVLGVLLTVRLVQTEPVALGVLVGLAVLVFVARPRVVGDDD